MNRYVKILLILIATYVGIVVVFESLLGYYQPKGEENLVITVTEDDGSQSQRVLSLFQSEGELYLAANHWPRPARAHLASSSSGQSGDYVAIPIDEVDHERVLNDNRIPFFGRFLMGFPPREFVRIEPVTPAAEPVEETVTPDATDS